MRIISNLRDAKMTTKTYKAGETIIVENETGDSADLINKGSVRVTVGQGAAEKSVAELGAGQDLLRPRLKDKLEQTALWLSLRVTRYKSRALFVQPLNFYPLQIRPLILSSRIWFCTGSTLARTALPARRRVPPGTGSKTN